QRKKISKKTKMHGSFRISKPCIQMCIKFLIKLPVYLTKVSSELDNGDVIPVSRRLYTNTNMAFIKYFRGEIN
ncbi:hypothetical protein, partial [Tissierella sp.]|uniref:hypothetical protein n=1 Tax=Tissierella sp. TaxID=41274 RepID=UPI0030D9A16A